MRWTKISTSKFNRLHNWHRKFALFPVRIGTIVVWLEFYSRKGEYDSHYDFWKWEYRLTF